eukprot:12248-Heterococcus_DN1.PRE.8
MIWIGYAGAEGSQQYESIQRQRNLFQDFFLLYERGCEVRDTAYKQRQYSSYNAVLINTRVISHEICSGLKHPRTTHTQMHTHRPSALLPRSAI